MPRKYIQFIMKQCSKNFSTNVGAKTAADQIQVNYENAVKALNSLQSNMDYIKQRSLNKPLSHEDELSKTILQGRQFLLRSGISLETLDILPVIHVSGTKGKGSTCALCESILRHHGFRTGFYSSPHLLEVRERISINGLPISKQQFSRYFWEVYNKLYEEKSSSTDMPKYFTFLTIMAFKIFLMERVDVAIIEVGIGGEYDCTNILRKAQVVGITSLGLDHTNMLGNTIEQIAWHKSGIMKPGSHVFTVPQTSSALEVLRQRSIERNCASFEVVKPTENLSIVNNFYPGNIFKLNSSLAIALSQAWIERINNPTTINIRNSEATNLGLLNFKWLGRYQTIHNELNSFYIDGAHTEDSMQICAEWFHKMTHQSTRKKALIFNATGERNSEDLLKYLIHSKFEKVFFVPNKATSSDISDMINYNTTEDQQIVRCRNHSAIWKRLDSFSKVKVMPTIADAVNECQDCNILVTGSLHLVGAALSIIGSSSTLEC